MRNRITYQNVGLLVGPSPAFSFHSGQQAGSPSQKYASSNLKQINLVQNASFNFNVARTEIQQIGGTTLTARKPVVQADVSVGFSYILSDGKNEDMLGFCHSGENSAFLSGQQSTSGDRNLFLVVTDDQAEDFNLQKSYASHGVLGFGNCFPINYSIQASVGSFPTASIEYLASNVKFDTASGTMSYTDSLGGVGVIGSGLIPAIDPANGQPASTPEYGYILRSGDIMTDSTDEKNLGHQNSGDIHYLRPGDVEMSFKQSNIGGINLSGSDRMHINSINIDVPINRTDLFGFGSKYVYDRRAKFPGLGNISFSATANNFTDGNLDTIFSEDQEYDFTITFLDHTSSLSSAGKPSNKAIELEVTKAKCQSQSFSQNIGNNMQVEGSFTFECTPFTGFKFSGIASN
jgi:hypothetical protein